ncbi:MAG: Cof-type HAD-IIB family hydrolase [Erysipelotrichaceae bacterium]|nr:Cof-type HAD-IIB family hydrolase [Erysipelotrichaceae bacterium]
MKIAFFDIDGTMIPFGGKPMSEKMRHCLKSLQNHGVKLVIATGRPVFAAPDFGVVFDGVMGYNGAMCVADGKVIYENPIPKEDVLRLIENADRHNHKLVLTNREQYCCNGMEKDLDIYLSFAGLKLTVDPAEFDRVKEQPVYQIMAGFSEPEYEAMTEGVKGARITAWWEKAVDIIPAEGGKGVGVQKYLQHYGYTKEDAVAFGDGYNDLEMLLECGIGVAMGNAKEEVKQRAHVICDTVENDGIYKFCLEKGWIDEI